MALVGRCSTLACHKGTWCSVDGEGKNRNRLCSLAWFGDDLSQALRQSFKLMTTSGSSVRSQK